VPAGISTSKASADGPLTAGIFGDVGEGGHRFDEPHASRIVT